MALFSVRSERQFCERLGYDMLFKWFLDMNILDAGFNHSVFSKNKEPQLTDEFAARPGGHPQGRWCARCWVPTT